MVGSISASLNIKYYIHQFYISKKSTYLWRKSSIMLKAIILDDEQAGIDILRYELGIFCPEVEVMASFNDPLEAFNYLSNWSCDILFLDISMPGTNGFDFLKKFKEIDFEVIFVTAYEEYALRAFDFYAVDYLLKPIETEKLKRAIDRIKSKKESKKDFEKFEALFRNLSEKSQKTTTLAIPTLDGFEIIDLADLVYLKADGNYTELKMKTKKILVSKTLGDFEKVLPLESFIRIHNSFVINLQEIRKYIKGDGGMVTISNGEQLPVSRINKPRLLAMIKPQF
jgi:two-component system, LytTR family, response regulator